MAFEPVWSGRQPPGAFLGDELVEGRGWRFWYFHLESPIFPVVGLGFIVADSIT